MKVSIFDVAKKSGLSVVTVSRVLNNATSVRPKNRERVLQAMKDLDYRPNASARSLASGKTGIIGLMLNTLHDTVLDAVITEINDYLAEHDYFLALSISQHEDTFHRSLFQGDRVDGVILLSPTDPDMYIMELKKRKIPFVILDNQQRTPSAPSVTINNFKGGYDATKHLIDLGHTEIAHVSGPSPVTSSEDREKGYLYALEEAGLKPFGIEQGNFNIPSGYNVARRWIESGTLPTAVFAADDFMAIGIMDAFKNEGIRIPQDVSIVGFDDQVYADEFHPSLTTIRVPFKKIGRQGVNILLKLIKDPSKRNATVELDPKLIVRESTGAPRHSS